MTLIVETGTASSTSESYASVAYCDTYHDAIGNAAWALLSTTLKEQALRRATSFLCQSYRLQWKGVRVNATQALDWPRYDVSIPDLGVFNAIASDVVPDLVQKATAEMALLASAGPLNPDLTQNVVSKQVGPIKIVYDSSSPQAKRYSAVNDILMPLIGSSGNGVNVKLRRV